LIEDSSSKGEIRDTIVLVEWTVLFTKQN